MSQEVRLDDRHACSVVRGIYNQRFSKALRQTCMSTDVVAPSVQQELNSELWLAGSELLRRKGTYT